MASTSRTYSRAIWAIETAFALGIATNATMTSAASAHADAFRDITILPPGLFPYRARRSICLGPGRARPFLLGPRLLPDPRRHRLDGHPGCLDGVLPAARHRFRGHPDDGAETGAVLALRAAGDARVVDRSGRHVLDRQEGGRERADAIRQSEAPQANRGARQPRRVRRRRARTDSAAVPVHALRARRRRAWHERVELSRRA